MIATGVTVGFDLGETKLSLLEHDVRTALRQVSLQPDEIATHMIDRAYVVSARMSALDTTTFKVLEDRGFRLYSLTEEGSDAHGTAGSDRRAQRAAAAAQLHRERHGGRLIEFPGMNELPSVATVAQILSTSAIEDVVALDRPVKFESEVVLDGFIRPRFVENRMILDVTPMANGTFRTFEIANPHQCCGGLH